jgi:hypothetical protein
MGSDCAAIAEASFDAESVNFTSQIVAAKMHADCTRLRMSTLIEQAAARVEARPSFAQRAFCFPTVVYALVAATVFAVARAGLDDPDIWWHLRNAEYLFAEHRWPRADIYSYTVYGQPWMNHEWLAEIPYYLAWRSFGLVGIKALSLLILEIIFGVLLYHCYRQSENIKAAGIACYLAILLGSVSFGPRTLLFGYVYLLILLMTLETFRSHGRARLWVLPCLFCLWVNTHGSWLLGLIVLGIFVAGGLVQGQWGIIEATRWSPGQLRQLGMAMAASIAALFVNPYGYRLVLYPFDMAFRQKLNIAHVAEWSSVDFHDVRGKIALIFIMALLLGALLSRRRWQLYELGFALFGIYMAFTYVRFLFLAGILTAPLIAGFLCPLSTYRPERDKPALNAALIAGVLAFMLLGFPTSKQLLQSVGREYPAEVLPQVASIESSERVLNYYLWGGYLGWNAPGYRDFIDSRVDVFEYAGVLKDYLDLLDLKDPAGILDKYHIQYVLFPPDEPLSYVLLHDQRWEIVYSGKISVLFKRKAGAGNQP